MSVVLVAKGQAHAIALFRSPGDRKFPARAQQIVQLFHAELAPYLKTELAPPQCDPISRLSPRLREVLAALLEGDSEQQIAARLGLTRNTTHQYVKAVFRSLGVHTRAELMAMFIRLPEAMLNPVEQGADGGD